MSADEGKKDRRADEELTRTELTETQVLLGVKWTRMEALTCAHAQHRP